MRSAIQEGNNKLPVYKELDEHFPFTYNKYEDFLGPLSEEDLFAKTLLF